MTNRELREREYHELETKNKHTHKKKKTALGYVE